MAQVTKEDVKEIVEAAVGRVSIEVQHANTTLTELKSDIKNRFDSLPCDRLNGEVKELATRVKLREEEFERAGNERKEMINGAWSFARSVKETSYSKEAGKTLEGKIEKLEEKASDERGSWEPRFYALLTAIVLALFKFKVI